MPTVFVTGGNGFVGSETLIKLVEGGYKVKAVVRSQDKADAFNALYPKLASSISWEVLHSITDLAGLTAAVSSPDIEYVIHLASPYFMTFTDNVKDVLEPAQEGTRTMLKAAAQNPHIKHVVVLSSFAAVMDPKKGFNVGKTYSYKDWNPATWEQAASSELKPFVYTASKTFAEKVAWEFIEQQKPNFSLTTLCPPMIYGPPAQPYNSMERLNESCAGQWAVFSGKAKEIPPARVPVYVDVRDVAKLLVASLTNPKAVNQRYIACSAPFTNYQAAAIVRRAFPEQAHRVTPGEQVSPPEHFGVDVSKTVEDFGIEWIPYEQTVVDMARAMFEKEKELAGIATA